MKKEINATGIIIGFGMFFVGGMYGIAYALILSVIFALILLPFSLETAKSFFLSMSILLTACFIINITMEFPFPIPTSADEKAIGEYTEEHMLRKSPDKKEDYYLSYHYSTRGDGTFPHTGLFPTFGGQQHWYYECLYKEEGNGNWDQFPENEVEVVYRKGKPKVVITTKVEKSSLFDRLFLFTRTKEKKTATFYITEDTILKGDCILVQGESVLVR